MAITSDDTNAYFDDVVSANRAAFDARGLGALFDQYLEWTTTGGLTAEQAMLKLRDTEPYKKRFAANETRKAKGLRELSAADYLNMEDQYESMMRTAGLPVGFYDNKQEDFQSFIAGDVSVQEAQQRIAKAGGVLQSADPALKQTLQDYYGIDEDHMLAYILDPSKAISLINNQYGAASVGAIAQRLGVSVSKNFSETANQSGVSDAEVRNAMASTNEALPYAQMLSSIYGDDITSEDIAGSQLNLSTDGSKKVKTLASKERANFSGGSGVNANSLGKSSAGQY
jgi:hypothetical protein